ncbi:MAG TPA: LamG-like jellyroll fold domain-containing protein, partial [Flavobacteriales bacterium]
MKRHKPWLALCVGVLLQCSAWAQHASTYFFSVGSGTYVQVNDATATRLTAVEADSGIGAAQAIGFNFVYEGVTYTQFRMSSNGFISFNTSAATLTTNDLSAANATSRPVIAPLWDDLAGSAASNSRAYYELTGSAPNRVLTVEWRNWEWNFSAVTPVISFQVKLYETTNVIEYIYRQESTPVTGTVSGSIGIGSATGSGAGSYSSLTSVSTPTVSSTTNTTTLNTRPATGTIYTFSPPVVATGTVIPDCSNGGFLVRVNVTATGSSPTVNILSDQPGNPGGQTAVGVGQYDLGPFADMSSVDITVEHPTVPAHNVVFSDQTFNCSELGMNALRFDGVNDRIDLGAGSSLDITGNQITLEAWIRPTAWRTESWRGNIINKEGAASQGYMLRCGAGGTLSFNLGSGTAWQEVLSPAGTLTLNTWQHVAGSYDGSTLRLYRNGVQVASANAAFNIASSPNNATIGDWAVPPANERCFPGSIDEVRIWSKALTPGAITSGMTEAACGDEAGLRAYYRFDQGVPFGENTAENLLTDLTPNGNTGTLAGFALTGTNSNWIPGRTGFSACSPITCPETGTPVVTNIGTFSADVAWTCDGCAGTYVIEYGPTGFTPGTDGNAGGGQIVTSGTTSVSLYGLLANTPYQVYVRQECGATDHSFNSFAGGFRTLCDVATVPWSDSFEAATVNDAAPLDCYAKEIITGTAATTWRTRTTPIRNGIGPRTGTDYMAHNWSANSWLFTPAIQLMAGTSYDFSFHIIHTDAVNGYTVNAGVGTTATAAGMTVLGTITNPQNVYQEGKYTFVAPADGIYFFGVQAIAPNTTPWYLCTDDWSVNITPSCSEPTAVTVSGVTSSGATVSWTCTDCVGSYIVEYGAPGFVPGTGTAAGGGTVLTSATNSVMIDGLDDQTTHAVVVRQDCSGLVSENTSATSFTTLCNVAALPITEGFNGISRPACWTEQILSGTGVVMKFITAGTNLTATPFEGSHMVQWNSFSTPYTNNTQNRLMSPAFTTVGDTSVDVDFEWFENNGPNYTTDQYLLEGVTVQYSLDGMTWTDVQFIPRHNPALAASASQWAHKTVTLPEDVGEQAQVFVGLLFHSGYGYNCYLDDLAIAPTPYCFQPLASVGDVTPDCGNGTFTMTVEVTDLSGATSVSIGSDQPGDPGAVSNVGLGSYPMGPFAVDTDVTITVTHDDFPECSLVMLPVNVDCSTFGMNALNFDGTNDRVSCGNAPSLNITGNAITLEAWIYPTSWRTNVYEGNIINKEGASMQGYMLRCGANGTLNFNLGNGTAWNELNSASGVLTLNTWQHVAGTYDGSTMRLYVNGVEVGNLPVTTTIAASPNPLVIGDWAVPGSGRFFPGSIDEVRIWNKAIPGATILANMNTAYCGNESGLRAYYRFNQGVAGGSNATETVLEDLTAYGNDGTLTGFALTGASSNWVQGLTTIAPCVPVVCPGPLALVATNVTLNGATIQWTNSSAPSYEYEVRTSGAPGSGVTGLVTSGTVAGGPINLSGLTPSTNHTAYVRGICNAGADMSDWESASFFNGYCAASGTSTTYYITNFGTTGGYTNITNSGSGLSSGGYGDFLAMSTSQSAGSGVDFTASFATGTNYFYVWVDWNNDLDFDDADEAAYVGGTYQTTHSGTINVPAGTANGSYRMRIRNSYIGAVGACGVATYGEAEDYTFIVSAPPTCLAPPSVSTSTLTTTEATLVWTASPTGPSMGYEWEVRTAGTPGSGSTGLVATGTTGAGVLTAPVGVTLTPNTTYQAYVRANCGSGDLSTWTSGSFFTGYCTAPGTSTTYYLTNFSTTGGYTNITNPTGLSAGGYGDFTAQSVSQSPEGTVNFTANFATGTNYVYVWVDWNNDLDFADAGETVFASTTYQASTSGSFIIPAGTATGNYRMRVRNSWLGVVGPCGTWAYGEAEDYTMIVVPVPTCLPPTALTAGPNITTVTLDWTNSAAPMYEYEVRTSGTPGSGPAGLAATGLVADGPVEVGGLVQATAYTAYVRGVCDGGNDPSFWGAIVNFRTALPCGEGLSDSGGPSAPYSNNENLITTYCPATPGDLVRVTFTSFNTEATWDKLFIFDGNTTTAPKFSSGNGLGNGTNIYGDGGWWGDLNASLPGPFLANNASGCLTFAFVSDGADVFDGFVATTTCFTPNNTCANAYEVGCDGLYSGFTTDIPNSLPANSCGFNGDPSTGGQNYWRYSATSDTLVTVTTCGLPGTDFDTRIAIY